MIEAELIHKTEILKVFSSDKIRQLLKLLYVDCITNVRKDTVSNIFNVQRTKQAKYR